VTYYLLVIHGDVEPELRGPYKSEAGRDRAAKRHRLTDPEKEDGLFPLDVPDTFPEMVAKNGNKPEISTYSGAFFDAR
jgi:hypothetical protein